MVVAERKPKIIMRNFEIFAEKMPDGRLTEPTDGAV